VCHGADSRPAWWTADFSASDALGNQDAKGKEQQMSDMERDQDEAEGHVGKVQLDPEADEVEGHVGKVQ
jgi:hypothetical protein